MKEYDINYSKLSNDVRHLEIHVPDRESLSCGIFVKTGSRNEVEEKQWGISHNDEHQIYGSSELRSGEDRGLAVDDIGADESANTEKEHTFFYINSRLKHIEKVLELLSEVFINPTFPHDSVKKETEVIVGEIYDYKDAYPDSVREQFESLIFDKTNMAQPILGTVESVRSQTREELVDYTKKWYRGGNMMVVLEGNVKESSGLVEKYFGRLPFGPILDYEGTAGYGAPGVKVVTKDTEQAHFVLGVPALSIGDEDYFTMKAIEVILGGHQILDGRTVQSSRIFSEVRSKRSLAYEISTSSFSGSDTGYIAIQGSVQPENFYKTLEVVREQMFSLPVNVTEREVTYAKEFLFDHLVRQFETPHKATPIIGLPALLIDKIITPMEMFEKISAINLKSIQNLASKILIPKEERLAILGPFDPDLKIVPKNQI